jgi:hypothetical protein
VHDLKWQPLLIEPKAETKRAKQEGNMETLINYDEIADIAGQAY